MGLMNIQPLMKALTGNSWHGKFSTVVFNKDDNELIRKYKALQTFPEEYMIEHMPKTYATKYIANAVPPLAIANWFIRHRLDDYVPHRISAMVDLFAGIGGWALALCYYLNYRIDRIIAIDIDKRALELYKLNIEKLCGAKVDIIVKDVMSLSTLPNADVMVISPPCESVSRANTVNTTCEPAVSLTRKALSLVNAKLIMYEEAPTKLKCKELLTGILRSHGFVSEYVNLMVFGSLNARKRLMAFRVMRL
jgi:site-specific DNA-cytosine methylase